MSRHYSVVGSFRFAFDGFKEVIKNEPNFKVHLAIGSAALIAALLVDLDITEWILLLFTICLVLILELLNTAVEKIVDLVSPEFHPKAKVAKDVAAAAVLLASILAIVVGLGLFIPKISYLY